jgi:ABC-type Fe3+ transport system permease subunit
VGICVVTVVVPVLGLVWRAGTPVGGTWSIGYLLEQVLLLWQTEARQLRVSLGVALATGILATGLALALCLAARGSVLFAGFTLSLAALAWTMPGPLVGQGYRDLVQMILPPLGWPPGLAGWLWDGPSPVPLIAVDLVRFLPCALALVWPAVHGIPRSLLETATLDGLGPWEQLREVILPLVRGAVLGSILAVGVLTLGELAASKRASTPDMPAYAETIFVQMHYGVTADLAARCLLLLGVVIVGGMMAILVARWGSQGDQVPPIS